MLEDKDVLAIQCSNTQNEQYALSSYSASFIEHNGHVLLIHQTQWNRLDITDLKTGELLTEREIIYG